MLCGRSLAQVAAGDGFTFALGSDGALYGCGHFKDEVGAVSGFTPSARMQPLFVKVTRGTAAGHGAVLIVGRARVAGCATAGWGRGVARGQHGRTAQHP
jgi:hypothetical protein